MNDLVPSGSSAPDPGPDRQAGGSSLPALLVKAIVTPVLRTIGVGREVALAVLDRVWPPPTVWDRIADAALTLGRPLKSGAVTVGQLLNGGIRAAGNLVMDGVSGAGRMVLAGGRKCRNVCIQSIEMVARRTGPMPVALGVLALAGGCLGGLPGSAVVVAVGTLIYVGWLLGQIHARRRRARKGRK